MVLVCGDENKQTMQTGQLEKERGKDREGERKREGGERKRHEEDTETAGDAL